MKKKIVSLLVILTTLCLFVPCITFAAVIDSGACGENLTWTFDDNGTLTISGTGDMYDYGTWVMGKSAPWYQSRYDIKK